MPEAPPAVMLDVVQEEETAIGLSRSDLMQLTKARLSGLVVVTAFVGYLLATRSRGFDGWVLGHTLIGTTLAAFAAAVFNQILETDVDGLMRRTAERPLPARRVAPTLAFLLGWLLAAVGLVHLLVKVGLVPAALAAATLVVYIFVYTPMKRRSSLNTLVGAVAGALPPLIGWTAGGGSAASPEGLFLFGVLFLWQLPHFLAINWLYREEYERAGFVMWSNGDIDAERTSRFSLGFSTVLLALMFLPAAAGFAARWSILPLGLITGWLVLASLRFRRSRTRENARRLFFCTLLYLPAILLALTICWR